MISESDMACRGGQVIQVMDALEAMHECQVCGTRVRVDMVDHPLFGFAAGCDKASACTIGDG